MKMTTSRRRPLLDKNKILRALRSHIDADISAIGEAQQRTQKGATHEESRAENDKDTRATESSYLARGLAERLTQLHEAAALVAKLRPRSFGLDDPIAMGALVSLEGEQAEAWYFVAPAGGGAKLNIDGQTVTVLTPQSPFGSALIGKYLDDEVRVTTPKGANEYDVTSIS